MYRAQFPQGGEIFSIRSDYSSGNFDFAPLGLKPSNAEDFAEMSTKELSNGRLAMIAAAGFLAQEAVTKATWGTAYGLPDF